jgi:putative heme-binding domain-containing protein
MPGLEYGRSDIAIWQVVAYVRSLSKGRAEEKIPGDPASGERLFREEADCGTCHRVNGAGGRRGPDLSEIGWLRSPAFLRTSLLKPDDQVEPRWWSARVTLEDGSIVEGTRMDEDSFSVRLLDAEEHLRAFRKDAVKSYERLETSTMPGYDGALDARQLDDLVAYLYSLRRMGR